MKPTFTVYLIFILLSISHANPLEATTALEKTIQAAADQSAADAPKAPAKVDVTPKTSDSSISARLVDIMNATGWFNEPEVSVKQGVVFLNGTTSSKDLKKWAEELARNTEDTVAVVNKIKVVEPAWNFEPIWVALKDQWNSFLTTIPSIFLGLIVLIFTYIISRYIAAISPKFLQNRVANSLLRKFISWAIGALVFLMGLYIIFNIMGLTAIALTVVGGTGLIGIILGIAFKDITENFLASLFLSVNNPFEMGDLVEIDNIIGYIESLTFRSTVLIKTNGTYVQIPNSTVYKSVIHNYTSNRKQREDFIAGIGYENNITDAQAAALKILKEHPAVLNYPEPLVLVDSLGSSCVNLKVYFWIDNSQNSSLKVKSSVMRLIKNSFANLQISMPDQDREIVFPDGINIQIEEGKSSKLATKIDESNSQTKVESNTLLTSTEGNFTTDENEIKEQAHQTNSPEKGSNLLSN